MQSHASRKEWSRFLEFLGPRIFREIIICIVSLTNRQKEETHTPASDFENTGVFSATKYKSSFQTDLETRKFFIQSFELDQNVILNQNAELKEA